jgi:hypothetical protein
MESSTRLTGSVLKVSTNGKPVDHSANGSPQLPLFSSGYASFRRPVALGIDAGHTARRHRELDARYRIHRHTQAVAKTQTRSRAVGNLLLVAFTLLGIGMAAYALRVDQDQQQQWERIR